MPTLATDELPPISTWDATPRDIATTRGLLMTLSRDRDAIFRPSLPTAIVEGVLTLGIRPLWMAARRNDRIRRYEWLQLATLADWWARHIDPAARPLADEAEARAIRISGRDATIAIACVGSVALFAVTMWQGGLGAALDVAFRPQSRHVGAIAYSAILSLAWLMVLGRIAWRTDARRGWLAKFSEVFQAGGRREVRQAPIRVPWIAFGLALLIAMVGPIWGGLMVAVLAVQGEAAAVVTPARQRLVERMLEAMDRSGLPVEFDIESVGPQAFVTGVER